MISSMAKKMAKRRKMKKLKRKRRNDLGEEGTKIEEEELQLEQETKMLKWNLMKKAIRKMAMKLAFCR